MHMPAPRAHTGCCKRSRLLSGGIFFFHRDTEGEFVDQVSLLFSPSEYNKLCREKQHGGSEAIYTSLWLQKCASNTETL